MKSEGEKKRVELSHFMILKLRNQKLHDMKKKKQSKFALKF